MNPIVFVLSIVPVERDKNAHYETSSSAMFK
jgi:hypothetical protein